MRRLRKIATSHHWKGSHDATALAEVALPPQMVSHLPVVERARPGARILHTARSCKPSRIADSVVCLRMRTTIPVIFECHPTCGAKPAQTLIITTGWCDPADVRSVARLPTLRKHAPAVTPQIIVLQQLCAVSDLLCRGRMHPASPSILIQIWADRYLISGIAASIACTMTVSGRIEQ